MARYVAKHGEPAGRVAKAVLVSAISPLMLKTDDNPKGTQIDVLDGPRAWLLHRLDDRGLSDGGHVARDFGATFWSPGFGKLTDRFGTPWTINTDGPVTRSA